jgi:hypothetical protein
MEATRGTAFGAWTVIGIEGRAAWARCQCGTVRRVSLEALQSGESQSCGCLNLRSTRQPLRRSNFARDLTNDETRGVRKRQFGGGIK